jgi:hypothetical protein
MSTTLKWGSTANHSSMTEMCGSIIDGRRGIGLRRWIESWAWVDCSRTPIHALLPALETHGRLSLTPEDRVRVLSASPATIGRLLSDIRLTARGGTPAVQALRRPQKNRAIVRRLVGYGRFEGLDAAQVLARLYAAARISMIKRNQIEEPFGRRFDAGSKSGCACARAKGVAGA